MRSSFHTRKIQLAAAALVLTVLAAPFVICVGQETPPEGSLPKAPLPRFSISKETTFITEPRDDDGQVDYFAATNRLTNQGVTPENNAAVLLFRALGPADIPREDRQKFYAALGIEVLPDEGSYFRLMPLDLSKSRQTEFDRAQTEPWTKASLPWLWEWIDGNEKPLQLVIEATHRPKLHIPVIRTPEARVVLEAILYGHQEARHMARALVCRAMFKLGAGQVDEAKSDLLACHRLARLMSMSPSLMGGLVGTSIELIADGGDIGLLNHGRLDSAAALAYQKTLRELAPFRKVSERFANCERLSFLDAIIEMTRNPEAVGTRVAATLADPTVPEREATVWNAAFRAANVEFDNSLRAVQRPTYVERDRGFKEIMAAVQKEFPKDRDPRYVPALAAKLVEGKSDEERGRILGRLIALTMIPNVSAASAATDRTQMRTELTQLGFGLVAFHADHGTYPEQLSELIPKYSPKVSEDLFTQKPLRYIRRPDGFVLYSVGENGRNDGGRSYDSNPPADDLVIKVDFAPTPRKP